MACKGLAAVAWTSVLASRCVRLGARWLIELRVKGSHSRVNRKREGSRSVRIKCSPPHMKIRGIHGVGILVSGNRADGSDSSSGGGSLCLRVCSDGGINHSRSIFVLTMRSSGMMAGGGGGSGCCCCDSNGVVGHLIAVRSRWWWCRTIDGISSACGT